MDTKIVREQVESRNSKIREYLLKNPEKLNGSYQETANKFNVTTEVVRHLCRRMRQNSEIVTTDAPEEFKITEQILIRRENAEIKSLKRQLEQAIKEYEKLSDAYDVALNLKTSTINNLVPSIDLNQNLKHEATAIVQISDGHFGKIVLPSTVNGLNEYNPTIARMRMERCAENTIRLIKKEREDIKIENLVLILGGDFLENSQLHHHSEMTTSMSPMEEVLFARELLQKYMKTVFEYGKFKNIVVACTRGNHARITHKMVASVDYRMNYETILYNILKDDFKDYSITWTIPDSEIAEVDVYGNMLRVVHGHQIKFQGGVGGLTVPLNKYTMRMDQINQAFYNFVHHYHSLSYPNTKTTVNGSIVGYDPYAMSIGCSYEPPVQSFQLLDSQRGMTIKAPIFCE
jgi:hypothetical protein